MSLSARGRQTVLREYTGEFPYRGANSTGTVEHFTADAKNRGTGNAGRTICGRDVPASELRTKIDVLSLARNPCQRCLIGLDETELETLALMASQCSQHEITPDDIQTDD